MKKEMIIFYSNKFDYRGGSYVDIIENVDGVDVANYMLHCDDLRTLRSNPIFKSQKFNVRFVRVKEGEEL